MAATPLSAALQPHLSSGRQPSMPDNAGPSRSRGCEATKAQTYTMTTVGDGKRSWKSSRFTLLAEFKWQLSRTAVMMWVKGQSLKSNTEGEHEGISTSDSSQRDVCQTNTAPKTHEKTTTSKKKIMNEFVGAYNLEHMNQTATPALRLIT